MKVDCMVLANEITKELFPDKYGKPAPVGATESEKAQLMALLIGSRGLIQQVLQRHVGKELS